MIPSDHFVRFYNEVFKALDRKGRRHLADYWCELGRVQTAELAESFRRGGLAACHAYWKRILEEENCEGRLTLNADWFEFRMDRCPSLSKVLDNDAEPFALYCDHCMGWIEPVMRAAGLHAVMDMQSRSEPHCVFRVYADAAKAADFERQAVLPSRPYDQTEETPRYSKSGFGMQAIDIGDRLELFVDDVIIDRMQGVQRRLHAPCRMPLSANPLDEGAYLTILKERNRFRAYYRGNRAPSVGGGKSGGTHEVTCCEESADGIDWVKPDRGLCTDGGPPHAIFDAAPFAHNLSPFLDERPGVPEEERYKALAGLRGDERGHLCAFVSADGLHWRRLCGEPAIRWNPEVHLNNAFDSQNVSFWSAAEGRYVAYFRHMGLREGERTLRTIGRAVSDDFITWRDESETFERPNLPGEELYTSQTHAYFRAPHLYIALPTRFTWGRIEGRPVTNEEGKTLNQGSTEIAFMTTRAGSRGFDRPFREAFIRPGLDPSGWENRANYVGLNVVPTAYGEMSIYHRNRHRYVLRTDGFVSVRAPFDGGEVVTRPLVYRGNELILNMSTGLLGGIRVELRTAEGRALPGCAFDDCRPILGDRIETPVVWKGGGQVGRHAGRPVRVAFRMNDSDLYSLRFRQAPE